MTLEHANHNAVAYLDEKLRSVDDLSLLQAELFQAESRSQDLAAKVSSGDC